MMNDVVRPRGALATELEHRADAMIAALSRRPVERAAFPLDERRDGTVALRRPQQVVEVLEGFNRKTAVVVGSGRCGQHQREHENETHERSDLHGSSPLNTETRRS